MKYNSIGEQLIAKAQELDPNYKPDKFNDMSEAIDILLNNSGGDIWLDITPYLNECESEETMYISQEGYDLIYNTFYPGVENSINKYVGIWMGYKLIFNGFTLSDTSDKKEFDFITNFTVDGVKGHTKVSINNDKSVKMGEEIDSSNQVWFNLGTISETITQDQYNEINPYKPEYTGDVILSVAGLGMVGYFTVTKGFVDSLNLDFNKAYTKEELLGTGIKSFILHIDK